MVRPYQTSLQIPTLAVWKHNHRLPPRSSLANMLEIIHVGTCSVTSILGRARPVLCTLDLGRICSRFEAPVGSCIDVLVILRQCISMDAIAAR